MPKLLRATAIPRPTRTAALLFAAASLLELLGRLVGSTSITVAAAAALGALIGDAALTPHIEGVTLIRHSPNRMTAGVEVPIQVIVTLPPRRRTELAPILLIEDHPAFSRIRAMTPTLRPGAEVVIELRGRPAVRGHWPAGGSDLLEAHSPLGGFVRRRRFPITEPAWVHPAPARPVPLPELAASSAAAVPGASRSGPGIEFYGTREWRSGDTAANVHWRASARRNQLIVMERERPAGAVLVIAIGTATATPGWEWAVACTAATAVAARRSGNPVTVIRGPEAGSPHTAGDILDWFAELDAAAASDPARVTTSLREQGPGTTLLWLSTEPAPAELQHAARAAGVSIMPIGVDPASVRR